MGKLIFIPSCKVTAAYPDQSLRLRAYLEKRYGIEAIGCCREYTEKWNRDDIAVTICNNCANIAEESTDVGRIVSVWEMIDSDGEFVFPDYHGKMMTLQDCWQVRGRHKVHNAVRSILRKMNIEVVEMSDNRDASTYCGTVLTSALLPDNARLVPKRYVKDGVGFFIPMNDTERSLYFKEYFSEAHTEDVVCYCRSCVQGVKLAKKNGVHLLELLFN